MRSVQRSSKAGRNAYPLRNGVDDFVESCPNRTCRLLTISAALFIGLFATGGCRDIMGINAHPLGSAPAICAVDLSTPLQPEIQPAGAAISTARNSWSAFALQLDSAQLPSHAVLRLPGFSSVAWSAFQVLPVNVDLSNAGYVRQTGEQGRLRSVPRVLLPLPVTGDTVDLSALRDPANPAVASVPQNGPLLIWVEPFHFSSFRAFDA